MLIGDIDSSTRRQIHSSAKTYKQDQQFSAHFMNDTEIRLNSIKKIHEQLYYTLFLIIIIMNAIFYEQVFHVLLPIFRRLLRAEPYGIGTETEFYREFIIICWTILEEWKQSDQLVPSLESQHIVYRKVRQHTKNWSSQCSRVSNKFTVCCCSAQ